MKVQLQLVGMFLSFPNVAWYKLAWHQDGVVYVRRPFHRIFFALQRLAHEIWHHVEDQRNAGHRPWWRFETRCGHALRLRWYRRSFLERKARELQANGSVEALDP